MALLVVVESSVDEGRKGQSAERAKIANERNLCEDSFEPNDQQIAQAQPKLDLSQNGLSQNGYGKNIYIYIYTYIYTYIYIWTCNPKGPQSSGDGH
jgi:hypothetical protein